MMRASGFLLPAGSIEMAERKTEHPIQPIVIDKHGTLRFKSNAIVCHLLDNGGIDLNALAVMQFDQNDREQFAQLIGYSLCGFSELSYVRNETYETAANMAGTEISEDKARIAVLENKLRKTRDCLRVLVPELFQIHLDE
jgi:hypothetical protein